MILSAEIILNDGAVCHIRHVGLLTQCGKRVNEPKKMPTTPTYTMCAECFERHIDDVIIPRR